ncbi:hypothetical protein CCR75_002456 [Bremia lactucae]|uniref:ERCC4 domain-containing protein n=1 Tax=Bremia lactucae TaxID=4779 RepID=A0A976FH55_BRELC|nr:hypothetical protein CCR75_002456 [Bremia lactucae]
MTSTPARKRSRTRPRDSLDNEDEDRVLDAMLMELGIPRQRPIHPSPRRSPFEIIELLTPSPPAKNTKEPRNDGAAVVDLTTPPSVPRLPPSTSNDYIQSAQKAPLVAVEPDFATVTSSPQSSFNTRASKVTLAIVTSPEEPEVLSPEMTRRHIFLDTNLETKLSSARRLSGRLRALHAETILSKKKAQQSIETKHSGIHESVDQPSTVFKRKRPNATTTAVFQMEKSLDLSEVGSRIRDALTQHLFHGKSVASIVSHAFDCSVPGALRWERKDDSNMHFSCAIYYKADTFLNVLQQSYTNVLGIVQSLQALVPTTVSIETTHRSFLIIEGMDQALVTLQKHKQKQTNASSSFILSFADLHEIAFQLFLDTNVHTKFTCDVDASAKYVALLTREFVVAASRATANEERLESVFRYTSFRVTPRGERASASANAWLRMLQVIPGVSEDKAQCLLNYFPTFRSLMQEYRNPSLSRAQKEDLVADKLHDSRIQRALSKRIYTIFCEENLDTKI